MSHYTKFELFILLSSISLLGSACELFVPVCGGDGPATVDIGHESVALPTAPVTGELKVEGWAMSERGLAQLTVGDSRATSEGNNYASWSVTLSQAELQAHGQGHTAVVPIIATDVCGEIHEADPLVVYVDAPTGSSAAGLTVTASAADDECYLPADGSEFAMVELRADASSIGVSVALSASAGDDFLPASASVRLEGEGEGAVGQALFRPEEEGALGLLASAGPSYAVDESGLFAAGAPIFSGAVDEVPREVMLLVRASTPGRLARCWAEIGQPGVVEVSGGGSPDLLTSSAIFADASCGQEALFAVEFAASALAGVRLRISCEDSYGQSSLVELWADVEATP